HIQLAVSLDGLEDVHDKQRQYADGRGSFRKIMENLARNKQAGVMPLINITISSMNAAGLPDLVTYLLENGYRFTFNLYRANIFSQDEAALALEESRITRALLTAFERIERPLPDWSLLGALTDRANLQTAHQYTCSAGRDYLVFDQRGRVSQCQMLLHLPVSNLEDETPLATVRAASGLFGRHLQNLPVDEKDECQTCPWRYWCAGGCPLEAKRAHGSFAAKSPNCGIYKAILPAVLRLEARRLIQQHKN
ncbi:MAG: SPASM domain-containing protein, partial [Anaerolineales bacterium]|nr:SPASM domain-containing protein [Anaerolineales bacterium]